MGKAVEWRPRGVVQGESLRRNAPALRFLPEPPLDAFIEHFWAVAWDLSYPLVRETLPHPSAHLVIEAGRSGLAGVSTQRFTRVLEDKGWVFGIKFRPGSFHPFRPGPMADLTDRVLPLMEAFGAEGLLLESEVLACAEDGMAAVARAEAFLLRRLPDPDPRAELARSLVEEIREHSDLLAAEAVAKRGGLSLRALQRLFSEYIGVSPKWVIQRYRLHEAMVRLETGTALNLPDLALDLGYFDQAHFSRDFKRVIGRTPMEYLRASDN